MLITRRTKTKSVLPFLNADRLSQILEAVEPYPLDKDVVQMTLGEFFECMDDSYAYKFMEEKYAYVAFGKLKSFKQQMEGIMKFLRMNEVKPNAEQERAAVGVVFPDFEEQALITVTEFFGLKSFDEAEQVKVSNFLLIHKKMSSEAKFKHQYDRIMEQKMKSKHGKRGR